MKKLKDIHDITTTARVKRLKNGMLSIKLMGYSDKIIVEVPNKDYSTIQHIKMVEDIDEVIETTKNKEKLESVEEDNEENKEKEDNNEAV